MRKGFKFTLAMLVARFLMIFTGRSSQRPLSVAMSIDKDFLKKLQTPDKVIAIMGTLGVDITENILRETYRIDEKKVIWGRNPKEIGIELLKNCDFSGKVQLDIGIFSCDLEHRKEFFQVFAMDVLVLTNIIPVDMGDSLEDIRLDILKKISSDTILVLNGDDPLQQDFIHEKAHMYGVDRLEGEVFFRQKHMGPVYSREGKEKEYSFKRFMDIGRVFASAPIGYAMVAKSADKISVSEHGLKQEYTCLVDDYPFAYYYQMAAIVTLRALGVESEEIANIFEFLPKTSLLAPQELSQGVLYKVSHRKNPLIITQILEMMDIHPKEKTAVILDMDSFISFWAYDADYLLNKVDQVYNYGRFAYEGKLAQLFEGVEKEKIHTVFTVEELVEGLKESKPAHVLLFEDEAPLEKEVKEVLSRES